VVKTDGITGVDLTAAAMGQQLQKKRKKKKQKQKQNI